MIASLSPNWIVRSDTVSESAEEGPATPVVLEVAVFVAPSTVSEKSPSANALATAASVTVMLPASSSVAANSAVPLSAPVISARRASLCAAVVPADRSASSVTVTFPSFGSEI